MYLKRLTIIKLYFVSFLKYFVTGLQNANISVDVFSIANLILIDVHQTVSSNNASGALLNAGKLLQKNFVSPQINVNIVHLIPTFIFSNSDLFSNRNPITRYYLVVIYLLLVAARMYSVKSLTFNSTSSILWHCLAYYNTSIKYLKIHSILFTLAN